MASRLDRWIRDDTGRNVLFLWPNPALWVFFLSYAGRLFTGDRLDSRLSHVGMGALIVWGLDELVRGDAAIRRVFGAAVLGWQLMRLVSG